MSRHLANPAPQNTFPVGNGYAPRIIEGGPRCAVVPLDFTVDDTIEIDFTTIQQAGALSFVQAVFVDNHVNPNVLTLTFDQTNQVVQVPAYAQGVWPVIAPISTKCTAVTVAGEDVECNLIALNMPMPLTQWGPITATANIVTSGAFTDRSGIGTGASVQIAAANAARKGFIIENLSTNANSIYVNFGAAATDNSGAPDSIEIMPGGSFGGYLGPVSTQAIFVLATLNEKFVAKEQ